MKAMKFFVSACLLTMSLGTMAQDEDVDVVAEDEEISVSTEKPMYHRVYVGFEGMTGKFENIRTIADGTSYDINKTFFLKGFQLGYAWGINCNKKGDYAVEIGAEFAYGRDKTDYAYCTFGTLSDEIWACALSVPVNITYKFRNVFGKNFDLMPFAGVRAQFNMAGEKTTSPAGIPGIYTGSLFENEREGGAMASDPHCGARAQAGAQVGVNAQWKKYTAGAYYGYIFNPFVDHCNEKITNNHMFSVNIGYAF